MSKPTSEITGVEVVEPRGADQRMSTPMQFCNRMEKHTALWWRLLRSADLLALTRVVRAASTVIGTDAGHGLVLEPEMAEAMDNLAIALGALPARGRRII